MASNRSTYRYIVYDILESLKSAFPDADIQDVHVLYWVRTIENLIRKRHLQSTPTGSYLSIFDNVPVLLDGQRKYVQLPAPIYDMLMEKGIDFITYQRPNGIGFTQQFFQPTKPSESFRLYYTPNEKPAPDNPYFFRVGPRIYFLGVEVINLKFVAMGLYTALDPKSSNVDLDSDIGLNEEQVHNLRIELLNMGRYVLMVPRDRHETGADDRSTDANASRLKTTLTNQQEQQQQQEQVEE